MPSTWTAIVKRGANQYVALCPEVDVASVGDTREEAERNLQDAIDTLVAHLREAGREADLEQRQVSLQALHEFLLDEEELDCPHRSSTADPSALPLGVVAIA